MTHCTHGDEVKIDLFLNGCALPIINQVRIQDVVKREGAATQLLRPKLVEIAKGVA